MPTSASPHPLPPPIEPTRAMGVIRGLSRKIGRELLEKALLAYYLAIDPQTPQGVRLKLLGALAYLGLPIDVIPDALPGGFVDDAAVLVWALMAVITHLRVRHLRRARAMMQKLGVRAAEVDPLLPDDAPLNEGFMGRKAPESGR
ncbi:YkvA family protein [Antribacter gilvus]|uniref:YkvA family protein n=1 Tax=Antribacter gilvus TaxID=2304675 RepID=UPI001980A5A6|nr:DUF1232 domain-containing protein [Antribacter gilvus]